MGPHLSMCVRHAVYSGGEAVGSNGRLEGVLSTNLGENSSFHVNSGLFQGKMANSMCDDWKLFHLGEGYSSLMIWGL